MIAHIFSVQGLAFMLPFLFASILFCCAQYGHLHFKHVLIFKISIVSAVVSLPVVIFLLPLIVKLTFALELPLLSIHALFSGLCFLMVLCVYIGGASRRVPNIIQIAGLAVFLTGLYYTLA